MFLYLQSPTLSLTFFILNVRYKTIPLAFLHKTLGFDSLEDTRNFLIEHQITTFINPNSPDVEKILDCKPAIPEINRAFEEKYRKVTIKGAI